MSDASTKSARLMFGELLDYLRQQGFGIGVDHYLRLQRLLDKINGSCAPGELRTLLCPIFATSKIQQEQFYRVFDSYFDLFQITDEHVEAEDQSTSETQAQASAPIPQASRKNWLYVAAPAALAIVILAFAIFLRPKSGEQPSVNQAGTDTAPKSTTTATPEPTMTAVQAQEATGAAAGGRQPVKEEASAPLPPRAQAPAPDPGFYERHRTGVHLAIILSPLVLFLLYEWYRFARRRLLLQKQQARKPPFVWPIRVDASRDGFYESEEFLVAARSMRRRQVNEFRRLDVEATVAATIERLGFPDFRYKSDSRVTEYLFLIDRASYRDHQARLFDELARTLEREGVFLVRFFFDSDPRICRDESGADVVQLAELQNRFGSHRLIIFGNGEKLLDQITGRLDAWTAIFNHWQDRAVLTPEIPERWGLREIALGQIFIVLPATLNGLLTLIDHFETTLLSNPRSGSRAQVSAPSRQATPEETVAELRGSLGEETFQWLAACAIYTELHWDLTLYIGSLPAMPPGLITEAHLLKLIRLPWFRTGVISDDLRWLLINELAPERQQAVRAAVIELLERDPAPPETFASDQYRLNLFTQRWLQSRTRKRLRELMRLTKELPRSQVVRDLTLIRFLESSKRSPLDFLLPDRLRKTFYHRGVPAFGLKTGARFLFTLILVGVAWIGIRAVAPKATQNNLPADLLSQNIDPPPTPTPINVETTPPQDTVLQPETITPPGGSSPILTATPSPVSSPATNPSPIKSDQQQTTVSASPNANGQGQDTLVSSGTERAVDSLPPVAPAELTPGATEVTGALEGSVVNSQNPNEPVAGAAVQIINLDSGVQTATKTGADGRFVKYQLPAGRYKVVVKAQNFKVYESDKVQRVDITLINKAVPVPIPLEPLTVVATTPTPTSPPRVVSGGALNSKALSLPKPVYPPDAVEAQASGKVVVQVLLDESGKVIEAKAIKGHPLLQQAAVRAAFQARFPQTILSGQPVKVTGVLNYNFEIKEPVGPNMRPQVEPDRRPPARPGGRPPRE